MRSVIATIDRTLFKSISVFVAVILIFMVLLACLQVLLRNVFDTTIPWGDILLRNLVLWIGMLGGILATRQGRQISIDLIPRLFGDKGKIVFGWISSIFVLVVVSFLAYASFIFVSGEKAFGSTFYHDMPLWYIQIILPVGFGLIALQTILNILLGNISTEMEGQSTQKQQEKSDEDNNSDVDEKSDSGEEEQ